MNPSIILGATGLGRGGIWVVNKRRKIYPRTCQCDLLDAAEVTSFLVDIVGSYSITLSFSVDNLPAADFLIGTPCSISANAVTQGAICYRTELTPHCSPAGGFDCAGMAFDGDCGNHLGLPYSYSGLYFYILVFAEIPVTPIRYGLYARLKTDLLLGLYERVAYENTARLFLKSCHEGNTTGVQSCDGFILNDDDFDPDVFPDSAHWPDTITAY